jgi:hypothetical protein
MGFVADKLEEGQFSPSFNNASCAFLCLSVCVSVTDAI